MADSIFLGSGDVRGPASATDGAIAVFDGTTGKLIKVGAGGGGYVSSITGTANQIVASAPTGDVTLSLSPTTRIATSISVGSATNAYAAIGVGTFLDTGSGTMRGLSNVQISSDTGSASFNLLKARGVPGTETTIVTGDTLGNVKGWGYDGAAYLNMASIRYVSTGTIGTNRVPTQMEFYTATDAAPSVLTKRFQIGASGDFLFGAVPVVPTAGLLTVTGSLTASVTLSAAQANVAAGGEIYWLTRTDMKSPADGELQIGPNAGTSGVRWNYVTDGTAWAKSFAGADTATVKASAFQTSTPLVALGAGGAATLGLTGGSGPATTTQNTWLRMVDSTGAAFWVPAWK